MMVRVGPPRHSDNRRAARHVPPGADQLSCDQRGPRQARAERL